MVMVRLMKYSDLGPPPSIAGRQYAPPRYRSPLPRPSRAWGAPVPVPDAEVSADQTLATQTEMSQAVAPIGDATGAGEVAVQQDIKIDDDTPPADFVRWKRSLRCEESGAEIPRARDACGTRGESLGKDLGRQGRESEQVLIMKSDAEIFNEPAIEAAKQFVFTPAYMNNGPVSVWSRCGSSSGSRQKKTAGKDPCGRL